MTKLIMLRVYLDTNPIYGGYYSPIHSNECITLLPIRELHRLKHVPWFLEARKIIDKCLGISLIEYYPLEWGDNVVVHNDPRPDLGFYTGHLAPRGRIPSKLGVGDYIVFMAGLAEYPEDTWYRRRTRAEITRAFRHSLKNGKAGIYLVAYIRVKEMLRIKSWHAVLEKYPQLRFSPHYYWLEGNNETVAVVGESAYIVPPVKFYDFGKRELNSKVVEVIGRDVAVSIVRSNFRKSRLIEVDEYSIEKMLRL